MGSVIDGVGLVIAAKDRLCVSTVRGELSSIYFRVEGTNADPLDCYSGLSYACDAVVIC